MSKIDVSYSPNQFLGWDFFCHLLQQDSSSPFIFCQILFIVIMTLVKSKKTSPAPIGSTISVSVPVPIWPSISSLLCFPAFPFVAASIRARLYIFTVNCLCRGFCTSRFDATEPTSFGPFWNTFTFVLTPRYTLHSN